MDTEDRSRNLEVVEVGELQQIAESITSTLDLGTQANKEVKLEAIKRQSWISALSVAGIILVLMTSLLTNNGDFSTNLIIGIGCAIGGFGLGKATN